jgi:hypothetical protein
MLSLNAPKTCAPRAASGQRARAAPAPVSRRSAVVVLAHGGPHGANKVMPTGAWQPAGRRGAPEHAARARGLLRPRARCLAGFIAEMRTVAMKLHTKDQAPKEGGQEPPKPQQVVRIAPAPTGAPAAPALQPARLRGQTCADRALTALPRAPAVDAHAEGLPHVPGRVEGRLRDLRAHHGGRQAPRV